MSRVTNRMRAGAAPLVIAGAIAPALRRRLRLPPAVVVAAAFAAPAVVLAATPRSRRRDLLACTLYMWAHLNLYEMPNDDPAALAKRARVRYPIVVDRVLGLGTLPTVHLQRVIGSGTGTTRLDAVLVWLHWLWFTVPNGTLAYILWREPERFGRAAARIYGTFELGAAGYWLLPTAPPWYAASSETLGGVDTVRRIMILYGERFWGRDSWRRLYSALGGNPLAAMPSLHFATAIISATTIAGPRRPERTLLGIYAGVLGFALVYLGEHYVVDLVAGAALAGAVEMADRRFRRRRIRWVSRSRSPARALLVDARPLP